MFPSEPGSQSVTAGELSPVTNCPVPPAPQKNPHGSCWCHKIRVCKTHPHPVHSRETETQRILNQSQTTPYKRRGRPRNLCDSRNRAENRVGHGNKPSPGWGRGRLTVVSVPHGASLGSSVSRLLPRPAPGESEWGEPRCRSVEGGWKGRL